MLTIHPPEIIEFENNVRLQAAFESDDVQDVLWFSTPKEYGKYLCKERGDAFLVAMLLFAMKHGEDISIEAPISERLYYTLSRHFVKALSDLFPGSHKIQIHCEIDSDHLENAGGVGTGLSCGIDSFCTVIEHTDNACPPDYRLTHLTFFNVGASGDYGGEYARELFHQRIEAVRPCANELDLPLVTLDSNISEILNMNFVPTHTYRNVAGVLALQKLFKTYYYSSSDTLLEFKFSWPASGCYDIYSLDMLSTNDTKFYSSGEVYSRVEKTEIVATSPLSYRYLNVCVAEETNCSRCHKCQRTMVALDIIGKLDKYKFVFDIEYYRNNRNKYFGKMLGGRKKDHYKMELYESAKSHGIRIPFSAYPYAVLPHLENLGAKYCPECIKNIYKKYLA